MATLESINARIAKLKAQAELLVAGRSTVVLEKIRGLMEKHGIAVGDIEAHVGKRRGRKPGAVVAAKQNASVAKYRDPKSGVTWSGHGRAPAWIASVKDRTKFLVDGNTQSVKPAGKATAKVGNYVRGVQPPMYRNPKTDETWSGRGRAPAWLAGAKDRTKFLIAGAPNETTAGAGVYVKKTLAKKVGVKKAVTKAAVAKKGPAKHASAAGKVVSRKSAAKKGPGRKTVATEQTAVEKETALASVAASTSANE